jgi:hypothetical protein
MFTDENLIQAQLEDTRTQLGETRAQLTELSEALTLALTVWMPSVQSTLDRLVIDVKALKELRDTVQRRSYKSRSYQDYVRFKSLRGMKRSIRQAANIMGIPYSAGLFYERATEEQLAILKTRDVEEAPSALAVAEES